MNSTELDRNCSKVSLHTKTGGMYMEVPCVMDEKTHDVQVGINVLGVPKHLADKEDFFLYLEAAFRMAFVENVSVHLDDQPVKSQKLSSALTQLVEFKMKEII